MSDNTEVWRVMNGLASWFNGQAGLIQNAAWMGALMLLAMATFNAAVRKSSVGAPQIGAWFFFMTMMGMTGTANIVNIYTGAVTTVANVPALVLIPSSMFSKAGYKVFTGMETAFQATTGSYMSITQNAFVGPLDVLLALRSPKLPSAIPSLNQTLVQVVADCIDNPGATAPAPTDINDSLDVLDWLQANGRQTGITTIYTPGDTTGAGTVSSCADAFVYINTKYTALANGGTELMTFINSVTKKSNPQNSNGLWGSANITNSFNYIVGSAVGMSQTSLQFTKNALTAGIINYTMDCLKSSGMLTSAENCQVGGTAMADARERYKTDAAMAGSGFLKTMFTSMGFLQVIFFSLFPFIALYGLIVVNKTTTVFGSYILFGIWSQSWLIVVAPIQSYVQTSVITDMSKIMATSRGMTMGNASAVYESLSTKLALASDLMANSQMLSLALLSGSIYALTGMVSKWSGSKFNDSSALQNKLSDSASIIKNNPMISASAMSSPGGNGSVTSTTEYGTPSWNVASALTTTSGISSGNSSAVMTSSTRAKQLQTMLQESAGITLSDSQAAQLTKSMDSAYQGSVGVSSASAKQIVGALFKGIKATPEQIATAEKQVMAAQGDAVTKLSAKDASFGSKLLSSDANTKAEAWGQVADTALDALSVGSVLLGGSTGVGAPLGVGGAAAIRAAKPTLIAKAKDMARNAASHVGDAAAAMKGGMANVAGAIGGAPEAMLKGVITDTLRETGSQTTTKTSTRGSTSTAQTSDAIMDAYVASRTKVFTETASKGSTELMNVTLNSDSMNRMAVHGIHDGTRQVSGEELRNNAAMTNARIRSGNLLKSDGSRFSPDEIASAEKRVETMLAGERNYSDDPSVTGQQIRDFKKNVLMEQALTHTWGKRFTPGDGMSSGADVATQQPNERTTQGKQAVPATKGYWRKATATVEPTKEEQETSLSQWKRGDDANNKSGHQAAKKAGFVWVAGKPAQEGKQGITTLAPSAETVNQDQSLAVNRNVATRFDSPEFKRAVTGLVEAADKQNYKAVNQDSIEASMKRLKENHPELHNEMQQRGSTVKQMMAVATAMNVVGAAAQFYGQFDNDRGQSPTTGGGGQAPAPGPGQAPAPGSGKTPAPGTTPAPQSGANPVANKQGPNRLNIPAVFRKK